MKYIGFDGVIVDTKDLLFADWNNYPERYNMPWDNKIRYIQRKNWRKILDESEIINNSIYYLLEMSINDVVILSKVYSLENEACAKLEFLRNYGVKQNIIFVPFNVKYTDVVMANGNILIDNSISNLSDWENYGGYSVFFDKNKKDNCCKYQRILRLDTKINNK